MSIPENALKYYYCACKYEIKKGSVKGLKAKELYEFIKLTDDLQTAINENKALIKRLKLMHF